MRFDQSNPDSWEYFAQRLFKSVSVRVFCLSGPVGALVYRVEENIPHPNPRRSMEYHVEYRRVPASVFSEGLGTYSIRILAEHFLEAKRDKCQHVPAAGKVVQYFLNLVFRDCWQKLRYLRRMDGYVSWTHAKFLFVQLSELTRSACMSSIMMSTLSLMSLSKSLLDFCITADTDIRVCARQFLALGHKQVFLSRTPTKHRVRVKCSPAKFTHKKMVLIWCTRNNGTKDLPEHNNQKACSSSPITSRK